MIIADSAFHELWSQEERKPLHNHKVAHSYFGIKKIGYYPEAEFWWKTTLVKLYLHSLVYGLHTVVFLYSMYSLSWSEVLNWIYTYKYIHVCSSSSIVYMHKNIKFIIYLNYRSVHTRDRICGLAFQNGRRYVARVWVPCLSNIHWARISCASVQVCSARYIHL